VKNTEPKKDVMLSVTYLQWCPRKDESMWTVISLGECDG
jgi:hypothetical protein